MSFNIESNNTTLFLVPPLGIDGGKLKDHGFLGAYLGDIHKPEIKHEMGVFMLFKPENLILFQEWLESEKERTPNLVEDYDYEDGYVVVIYVIQDKFKDDYKKFIEGKYSKMGEGFKSMFSKTVRKTDNMGRKTDRESWQWRIFKKDPKIREQWENDIGIDFTDDMEVWSSPTLNNSYEYSKSELLNIDEIKEKKPVKTKI